MDETWEYKIRNFQERLDAARAGKNPSVIAWMQSGYVVMCDTQLLPGYVIQLPVPLVEHLNSLELEAQTVYLRDMALIGRALEDVTQCRRVMYGIYGGLYPVLHTHIMPRYEWEGEDFKRDVGHAYPHRFEPEYLFSPQKHGDLQKRLRGRLFELMLEADAMP